MCLKRIEVFGIQPTEREYEPEYLMKSDEIVAPLLDTVFKVTGVYVGGFYVTPFILVLFACVTGTYSNASWIPCYSLE